MKWGLQIIIITIIFLVISTHFQPYHLQMNETFFWILSGIFTLIFSFIYLSLMKHFNYNQYSRLINYVKTQNSKFIIAPPILAQFLLFFNILCYINQHKSDSPIQSINSTVSGKYIVHRKNVDHYHTIIILFTNENPLDINNEDLYRSLTIGDKVNDKIRDGYFYQYFALELTDKDTNHVIQL